MTHYSLDNSTVDLLQDLLSINIDSQHGFEEVEKDAKDPTLKDFFRDMGQRRAHNAAELRQVISSAGREPTQSGSVSAAIHRWWINAKQMVSTTDSAGILAEAERGEDSIRDEYEHTLEEVHDPVARDLISEQFRNVVEGHDKVKALRDSYRLRNPRE